MSTDLAVIEAALKAATPGPWQVYESIMADTFVYGPRGILRDDIIAGPTYNRENAHLIVLLRNSAAELVERVKVAEARASDIELLNAVAAVTPCSCSVQRQRAEAAEAQEQVRRFANDARRDYAHISGCGGDPECPACWAHDILRALDGDAKRCTSDITLRDEEHCLCRCTLTGGHAGVHDDGAGTTWTGGDA